MQPERNSIGVGDLGTGVQQAAEQLRRLLGPAAGIQSLRQKPAGVGGLVGMPGGGHSPFVTCGGQG